MSLFSKEEIMVNVNNIEVGFVTNSEGRHQRKIVFARNTGSLNWDNSSIKVEGQSSDHLFKDGIDLCEKINGEDIIYPVISDYNYDSVESDIVICKTIKVGNILKILGFSESLTGKDLKTIKKLLLDPEIPFMRERTELKFNDFEKMDLVNIQNTLKELETFKKLGNTTSVTDEERKFHESGAKKM